MKKLFFAVLFIAGNTFLFAQKKSLHIQCDFPAVLKQTEYKELKVSVGNSFTKESTGHLTFEIFNADKNISVDGWFLNVFPFQYFTATPQKTFTTTFPFTVPGEYKGNIRIVIKAICGNVKDSISQIITVK
ncbi:MAG: hypothetical protein J0I09_00485 [Sphingobacteriia bacterium]|nr:hypothetical protein [Sphingobacteriia bacterium]